VADLDYALSTGQSWTFIFGIALSISPLCYLPIGTFISIIVLGTLLVAKEKIGI